MPNLNQIFDEILEAKKYLEDNNIPEQPLSYVRRKYIRLISEYTGRNTIAYYSGMLHRPDINGAINDKDIQALMLTIHGMGSVQRAKGLDLILHTPGGEVASTEAIVEYLHEMFSDIRAIVPQLSMSAGTMIALSCRSVMMGKQSSLGPIDPQLYNYPCQGVVDEFENALKDVKENPDTALVWREIVGKYHPTYLNSCRQAIDMSRELLIEWLSAGMSRNDQERANRIIELFASHGKTKMHARHISKSKCKAVGVEVIDMDDDQELQDLILSCHHAFMHTFFHTFSIKIVENNMGVTYEEFSTQNG